MPNYSIASRHATWRILNVTVMESNLAGVGPITLVADEVQQAENFASRFTRHMWDWSEGRLLIKNRRHTLTTVLTETGGGGGLNFPQWAEARAALLAEGVNPDIYDTVMFYHSSHGFPSVAGGVSAERATPLRAGYCNTSLTYTQPSLYGSSETGLESYGFGLGIPEHELIHILLGFYGTYGGADTGDLDNSSLYEREDGSAYTEFTGLEGRVEWLGDWLRGRVIRKSDDAVMGITDDNWAYGTPRVTN